MENISVSVRLRALTKSEEKEGSAWRVDGRLVIPADADTRRDADGRRDTNDARRSSNYTADHVFGPECSTEQVYQEAIKALVHDAVDGKNVTIMTYGQTGSGKTYTMGTPESPGIIQRTLMEMFGLISEKVDRDFLLRFSYLEIYNENVTDLLSPDKMPKGLLIKEDKVVGPVVLGLSEEIVTCPEDVLRLLKQGEAKRHVASSKMNERSNRSHSVARMVLESRCADCEDTTTSAIPVVVSNLVLVDLAGSESVAKTGAEGERLKESSAINKSLLALGEVVFKLSEGALAAGAHIPYRDSKLTRILKPSLGGNAKTMIICTVNPAFRHLEESHRTLRFACRAKRVVNTVVVTEVVSETAALRWQAKEIKEQQRRKAEEQRAVAAAAKAQIEALRIELLRSEEERLKAEKEAEAAKQLVMQTLDRAGETPLRASHNRNRSWSPTASSTDIPDIGWTLLPDADKALATATDVPPEDNGASNAARGFPEVPTLACSPELTRARSGERPNAAAAEADPGPKLSPDKMAAASLLETCRRSKGGPASSRDLQEAIDRWRAENVKLAEENAQLRHDMQPKLRQELQWLTATIATHEALNAQLQSERDAALQLVEGLQTENAELQREVAEAHRQQAARKAEAAEALAAAKSRASELEALVRHLQKEVEAANDTVESVKARNRAVLADAQQAAERHAVETAELRDQLSALLDELDMTRQKLRVDQDAYDRANAACSHVRHLNVYMNPTALQLHPTTSQVSEAARSADLSGTRAYGDGGLQAAAQQYQQLQRQQQQHSHHSHTQPQHSQQQASQQHASSICLPQPPEHPDLASLDREAEAHGLLGEVSSEALAQLCRHYTAADPSLLDGMAPALPPLPVTLPSVGAAPSSSTTDSAFGTQHAHLEAPSATASSGSSLTSRVRPTQGGGPVATDAQRSEGSVRSAGGSAAAAVAAVAPGGSAGSRSWTGSSRRATSSQDDVRSSTAGSLAAKAAAAAAAVAAALRASTSAVFNATGVRSASGFSLSVTESSAASSAGQPRSGSQSQSQRGGETRSADVAAAAAVVVEEGEAEDTVSDAGNSEASVSELAAQLMEAQVLSARQDEVIADLEAQLVAALAEAEVLRQQARASAPPTQRTESERTPELTAALEAALEAAELALLKAEGRAAALADERDALQEKLAAITATAEEAREALARRVVAEAGRPLPLPAGTVAMERQEDDLEEHEDEDLEQAEGRELLSEGPNAGQVVQGGIGIEPQAAPEPYDETEVLRLREEAIVVASHLRSALAAKDAAEEEADRLRATLEDCQGRLRKATSEVTSLRRELQHRATELSATRRAVEEREAKLAALRATLLVCELPSKELFGGDGGGGAVPGAATVGATTPGRQLLAGHGGTVPLSPGVAAAAPAAVAANTAASPAAPRLLGGPTVAAVGAGMAPGSAPPGPPKGRRVAVRGTPGPEMLFQRSVTSRRLSPKDKGAAAITAAGLTPAGQRRRYASDSNEDVTDADPSPDVSRRDAFKRRAPPVVAKSRQGGGNNATSTLVSELFERLDRLERSVHKRPPIIRSRGGLAVAGFGGGGSRVVQKQLLDVKAQLCGTGCGLQLTAPNVEQMQASASLPRDAVQSGAAATTAPGAGVGNSEGGSAGTGPPTISAQLSITLRSVR